ncbi:MAG TPA: DNA photolyase [Elusimicrobiota bacterium]|nr:DNA photolyase [Elusimicrobiota bacterium]
MQSLFPVTHILLDESARELPTVRHWTDAFPHVPTTVLGEGETPDERLRALGVPPNKTVFFLTRSKGGLVKQCPGRTDHYVCCGLQTLDPSENCSMACSYCFLQSYLTNRYTVVQMDYPALTEEVRQVVSARPDRLFRFCTGELSDSLSLDPITRFSRHIVPFFSALPNALLELKTKTSRIENLRGLSHGGRTVVSWSLNPPAIIQREENGCAPLPERLAAARDAASAGYKTAFHFDPLIHYTGCHSDYSRVLDDLFATVPVESIAWISLGTLRITPFMREQIPRVFPKAKVTTEELVRGYDGKLRYLRPIRHGLYSHMLSEIRRKSKGKDVFVYLCMEDAATWKKFFDPAPTTPDELDLMFKDALLKKFPDLK